MEISKEIDEEEHLDELKKSKTKKRKRSKIDDGVIVTSSKKRNIKGIMLSVTKPSYTLKQGIGRDLRSLRWEHRNRLRYLLRQLVRRQNWDEACGVLSLLLKGTHKENGLLSNRTKYWATLELLEHMRAATRTRVQNVYDIWMKKDPAVTKNKQSLKGRFDVQLEYLLFWLSQGDTEKAHQTVISIQQESDFSNDPIANLVVGLAFSHIWYNAVQEEFHLHDSLESGSSIQSGISGPQEIMSIDYSNGQSAVEIQDSDSAFQPDSNTSIRIGKDVDQDRIVPMEVDHELKKEIPEYEELRMSSDEGDENGNLSRFMHTGNKNYGSIVYAHDLDDLLMPLKFRRTNDLEDFISLQNSVQNEHYKAAVKHLQNALHSTPPAFESLLPLIQMLLLGDQVKEAIEEVESAVQNSHASLPFRLKASLLEHFSKEDPNKLCICFEDTLRKDPTCSHSLAKLISLHHDGYYNIERLLEMIALHLDATYADCNIWKEFASCFIELSGCDEDRISSCVNSYGDSFTKFSKNIPDMFQDKISRKNWRLRCRWWLTRHFTLTILASEITSGNLELVAYKAASACHLYGPEVVPLSPFLLVFIGGSQFLAITNGGV
ncbi:hypothetical protein L1987_31657 [Smallanthus sonchifolius]|uniref:Uncharacterized protein n=1 Tax=Smallanthus sonchifolius TaxID=185202 RepID=A0ACB9I691_9ASTR|nr:hypothetical protein L1987_31657 [Smallanthus sonchifolius]